MSSYENEKIKFIGLSGALPSFTLTLASYLSSREVLLIRRIILKLLFGAAFAFLKPELKYCLR